jgi:hypothetical protein
MYVYISTSTGELTIRQWSGDERIRGHGCCLATMIQNDPVQARTESLSPARGADSTAAWSIHSVCLEMKTELPKRAKRLK